MIVAGYEGYGPDVIAVARGHRAYEAVRNCLAAGVPNVGRIEVNAMTTEGVDCEFAYVILPKDSGRGRKITKRNLQAAELYAAGVLAGVKYYS